MKKTVLLAIIIITAPITGMQRGDAANASCSGGIGAWGPSQVSALAYSLEQTTLPSGLNQTELKQSDMLSAVLAPSRNSRGHTRTPSQPIIAVHTIIPSPELQGIHKRPHAYSPLPAAYRRDCSAYDDSSESVLVIPPNDENLLNSELRSHSPASTHTAQSHYSHQSKEIEDICERIEKLCMTNAGATIKMLESFQKRFSQAKELITKIREKLEDPSVCALSIQSEISAATTAVQSLNKLPLPNEKQFDSLKEEALRLATILYRLLQPTDISPAVSPAKRRAASTVASPSRPYTARAKTDASSRAFQLARCPASDSIRDRVRGLIPLETLAHYDKHAIIPCDIDHVTERHTIAGATNTRTLDDILTANVIHATPVYRENRTGIIHARNTDMPGAPLKSFFNSNITRDDIGPLLKSLNNPEETICLATAQKNGLELLHSKRYGFTVILIAHTRYDRVGIPSRVPTVYPAFSHTIISPHARHDHEVRIIDALELTQNEPFTRDYTISELREIVVSILYGPDEELRKECCFESSDPAFVVIDIAPFLAQREEFPIKQSVIISMPTATIPLPPSSLES